MAFGALASRRIDSVAFISQYLNVIESVFSGMAKAVIHNSDYQSVEEAMAAIDRHFLERNGYFAKNPKRAGKKFGAGTGRQRI